MAKVFLDANYLIDTIHRKPEKKILESLEDDDIYTSPISWHIYCYVYKIKIPDIKVAEQQELFYIVDFSETILSKALEGPTNDFEDNVQLHSAAEADCDIFLTEDKKLLGMKFFGKVKILSAK